jgi:hypothetical protein
MSNLDPSIEYKCTVNRRSKAQLARRLAPGNNPLGIPHDSVLPSLSPDGDAASPSPGGDLNSSSPDDDLNSFSPDDDPPDFSRVQEAVNAFLTVGEEDVCNEDRIIDALHVIFDIVNTYPFYQAVWDLVLSSGLLCSLASALEADLNPPLLDAHLCCFSRILRYPPVDQLIDIELVMPEAEFLSNILFNLESIPRPLWVSYVCILAHAVRISSPHWGAALNRVADVAIVIFDKQAYVCAIQTLGQVLVNNLRSRCSNEAFVPEMSLDEYLRTFVDWLVYLELHTLSNDAIVSVFEGLEYVTSLFPKLCATFCDFVLCAVDAHLRGRGKLYPRLRECFLNSIENMVVYQPLALAWELSGFISSFCQEDDPDLGIQGLEILSLLVGACLGEIVPSPDLEWPRWFVTQMHFAQWRRRKSLLRCFATILSHVNPDPMCEGFQVLFYDLVQMLDDWMSSGDLSGVVVLSLQLLAWFVDKRLCEPMFLCQMSSLLVLSRLDKRLQTAGSMRNRRKAVFIAKTVHAFNLYLKDSGLEPLPGPVPLTARPSGDTRFSAAPSHHSEEEDEEEEEEKQENEAELFERQILL